jgi:hydroxymethylbilane synthase
VVASRGSRLALIQAELVTGFLRSSGIEVEIRTVKTTGDHDRRSFAAIGGRGLFVAEVEREVAEGRADIAVHSAKDLTAELAPGCAIVCIPARAAVEDVVVGGTGETGDERLASLPSGATVGTSSMRRRALLAEARSDIEVVDLRGNLETRLRKVRKGVVDAAVLAAAGIERLGVVHEALPAPLDSGRWVTAPGQGALAVEAVADRTDLIELLAPFNNAAAWAEVTCERSFAARLEGGCSVPLGCCARLQDTSASLVATGYLGHPDGSESIRDRISGGPEQAAKLGWELGEAMLRSGGDELLDELRSMAVPEIESP